MSSVSPQEAATPATARSREFWRSRLLAGSVTRVPRWTAEDTAGVAEHLEPVSAELAEALSRLADQLAVSPCSVLLAVHSKVLSTLTGERDVATGYVATSGSTPLPCLITTEPRTWRELWLEAQQVEADVLAHADYPVEGLRRELGLNRLLFETVVNPKADDGTELDHGCVLMVGVATRDGIALRVQYRTEVFDAASAARIAGYHLAALRSIAAGPEAPHEHRNLLGNEERRFQLEHLAGPRRRLPNRRVHELFEDRVRAHPDAVAAECGGQQWTYRELNSRANRLAHALLAHGVTAESVVGVVTERNLSWMAAVLAIFKAGGAYLPIEPLFPADRIARMLRRAQCGLVLTEAGSTATLNAALAELPDVETLLVDAADDPSRDDADPGVLVAPEQLAYIYFTSGSTGEPKGVMCEHAGMLNHMYAKLDDLDIREGDVVAQSAPQCFDISLWQLLAAVLVGGQTLLVEQEAVMDAARFLDRIVDGRAAVVQVVPSYLEVLLTCLVREPRELPHLRCVSVTGEAVKKELVERWFAVEPAIKLINAYGLTETSDDTNHEVMDAVPERDRVPLGRPVNNVAIYIVDEHLGLVPLGAPGEIVFSGMCVGRGYINDPERTGKVFVADPHCEGSRLYRSGDFGRWLPEGKLEFLGRRDAQVKISGFRIEIGEIENALLRQAGVGDAAVIVAQRADHSKRLVAFYSADQALDAEALRARLRVSLPDYMVPAAFHWRASLPLTANGKIDRKALTALAGALDDAEHTRTAPSTAAEWRLATAWAQILGISPDRIGRTDDFFDLGGTSLGALKLAIALERAVSFKDIVRHRVLADQARLLDGSMVEGDRAGTVAAAGRHGPRRSTPPAQPGERL